MISTLLPLPLALDFDDADESHEARALDPLAELEAAFDGAFAAALASVFALQSWHWKGKLTMSTISACSNYFQISELVRTDMKFDLTSIDCTKIDRSKALHRQLINSPDPRFQMKLSPGLPKLAHLPG